MVKLGATEDDVMESAPLVDTAPKDREIDYLRSVFLFVVPALGGLLFGYDIGATSGAIDSIKSATNSGTDWYDLTSFQEGLVVSTSLLGGMVGSIAAAGFGSKIGRKAELIMAALLYGVGTGIVVLSDSYASLCAGRLIYGTGIGLAMHGGPSYIVETAPASLRGIFITLKEALIVFGILLGYFCSFLTVDRIGGWRWDYGAAIPLIVAFGTSALFLPESPRLLILKGRIDEAKAALRWICGRISDTESVVESETTAIQSVITGEGELQQESEGLFQRRNWKALYITLSLVVFQQATGQPSVLYYAQEILKKANLFSDSSGASGGAVILGVWKLITTIVAASRVESLGRRPLLLYGVSGLTAALIVLGTTTWLDGVASLSTVAAWIGVSALLAYVGCYQFSFGPVTWLLVGELYPLDVRTQGIALCTFMNFGSNFVVSLLFPVLVDVIGLSAQYFIFSLIGVASIVSIFSSVPETKGKSLEEIEVLMES